MANKPKQIKPVKTVNPDKPKPPVKGRVKK